jgi:DNA polymerase I-like protein with 3'-5' exonuclease and polymerase domains
MADEDDDNFDWDDVLNIGGGQPAGAPTSQQPAVVEAPAAATPAAVAAPPAEGEDEDLALFASPGVATAAPAPVAPAEPARIVVQRAPQVLFDDEDDGASAFMSSLGLQSQQRDVTREGVQLEKPWMKFHRFVLVKSADEVRDLVDRAIAHGRCALDLETEGFDNRIDYDEKGQTSTRHKIVGYCIGLKGVGYYIPVRHKFDKVLGERDPNVPLSEVDAEIKRLCQASQPVLTAEGLEDDPYASMQWVTPPRVIIYFWNAKFDQEFLLPVTGIDFWHPSSFEDGMLAAYVLFTDDLIGLKEQAPRKLSILDPEAKGEDGKPLSYPYEMIEFADLFPKGTKKDHMKFADLYPEDGLPMVKYGCSDAICTELLCETKREKLDYAKEPAGATYKNVVTPISKGAFASVYKLEKQTVQAVRVMERTRTKVDKAALEELLEEAQKEKNTYLEKITKLASAKGFAEFNPGSPQQLGDFLFSSRGLDIHPKPDKNASSDQFKTDAATLEAMFEAHPDIEVLSWVVKYRQIDKIIGTYLTGLVNNCDEHSCLRFNFRQTGAATGRFTAPAGRADHGFSGIPIQGIPARSDPKKPKVAHSLRKMFVARDGYTLVKIDYAGQELRIVANISGEPKWVDEFLIARQEGREADLHTLTAKAFFGDHITKDNKLERNMGKIANFSLIYGGGVQAIQRATKCDKVEAARRKANFDKSVPVFAKWVAGQHAFVKAHKGVKTGFNRFIAIPDANVKPGDLINGQPIDEQEARRIRAGCERKSTNFPIQGSGADILKISLIRLVKELGRLGWLKTGGDDSVRMLMTVHDEIVFEIRHDRLQEALPLISKIMESPSDIPNWKIPLVVEPLIGLNWEAKYDWYLILAGKEPVPDWLQGHVIPGAKVKDHYRPIKGGAKPTHPAEVKAEVKAEPKPTTATEDPEDIDVGDDEEPSPPPKPKPAVAKGGKSNKIATFILPKDYLTRESIRLVMKAISGAAPLGDEKAKAVTLRIFDQQQHLLVDPRLNIQIDPERFERELADRNLSSGGWDLTDEGL